jgi:uncharacterized membrane-anchored protein YhcB (DUF1043 family)
MVGVDQMNWNAFGVGLVAGIIFSFVTLWLMFRDIIQ